MKKLLLITLTTLPVALYCPIKSHSFQTVAPKSDTDVAGILAAIYRHTHQEKSALYKAVSAGDLATVESLVANGVNINEVTAVGATALHAAIATATDVHDTIALFLIEKGANIHAKSATGSTPLHFAVDFNRPVIVKELLRRGADKAATDRTRYRQFGYSALV